MSLRVLWRNPSTADVARRLPAPDGVELRFETDADRAASMADWPEVVVDGDPSEALLDGARLRRVLVPFAGLHPRLRERAAARPHLRVHNSHYNADMVAQHAVALLLAATNRIVPIDGAFRHGDWGRPDDPERQSLQLDGRHALLLGYGAIGKAIARRLTGLGLTLRALRRNPDPDDPVPSVGPDGLLEALERADVVMVSLPGTPETEGMIDRAAFARMKPTTVLINVGRGSVVEEEALYQALRDRAIFGAGIDVWYQYPADREARSHTPPAHLPFAELDNVVMSPHRANDVLDWQTASARAVLTTLGAIAAGEERNLVDVGAGY